MAHARQVRGQVCADQAKDCRHVMGLSACERRSDFDLEEQQGLHVRAGVEQAAAHALCDRVWSGRGSELQC